MIYTNLLTIAGLLATIATAAPTTLAERQSADPYFALVLPGGRRLMTNSTSNDDSLIAGPGGQGAGSQFFIDQLNGELRLRTSSKFGASLGARTPYGHDQAFLLKTAEKGERVQCTVSNPAGNNGALNCAMGPVKKVFQLCNNNLFIDNNRDFPGCGFVDLQAVKP